MTIKEYLKATKEMEKTVINAYGKKAIVLQILLWGVWIVATVALWKYSGVRIIAMISIIGTIHNYRKLAKLTLITMDRAKREW
jgi:hypothetical protein